VFIDVPKSTVRTTISLNAVLGRHCTGPTLHLAVIERGRRGIESYLTQKCEGVKGETEGV